MNKILIFMFLTSMLGNQVAWSDGCTVSVPLALFQNHSKEFIAYSAKKNTHEMKESGQTKDGTLFSVFRGGCIEYGEIWIFKYAKGKGTRASNDMAFWVAKSAKLMSSLAKLSPNSNLSNQGQQLEKTAQSLQGVRATQKSLKIGDQQAEITIAEESGKIKIQISKGEIL